MNNLETQILGFINESTDDNTNLENQKLMLNKNKFLSILPVGMTSEDANKIGLKLPIISDSINPEDIITESNGSIPEEYKFLHINEKGELEDAFKSFVRWYANGIFPIIAKEVLEGKN